MDVDDFPREVNEIILIIKNFLKVVSTYVITKFLEMFFLLSF